VNLQSRRSSKNPRRHDLGRYGASGALCQAADGFPSVYGNGLPALKQAAIMAPADAEAVRVHACFSLIAAVEDTHLPPGGLG
jgi:triphosphoribosyl-dephospho-CoA synthase